MDNKIYGIPYDEKWTTHQNSNVVNYTMGRYPEGGLAGALLQLPADMRIVKKAGKKKKK